jgi:CDP-diacylglycerol--serine O-phosphatidyltransferase
MLKPIRGEGPGGDMPAGRRRRRLRTIAMLPTLLTLGNLYFGFAGIYCCGRELQDLGAGKSPAEQMTLNRKFWEKRAPSFLAIAAWTILGSMICDALDGRVARKTGQASRFGEELDSLADVVSFGVAPGLMMTTLVHREIVQWGHPPWYFEHFGQMSMFIGAIYACCAALRLARFNVEATMDEAAHQGFKGLPSPGGAAAVVSVVFLHDHLDFVGNWEATADVLAKALPVCTLAFALLMVSRVQYTHAVSWLLRRRPFEHVILVLLALPLIWIYTAQSMAVAAWFFALSGPARYVFSRVTGRPTLTEPGEEDRSVSNEIEANKKIL